MLVVPIETKIYILKVFYVYFLLLITSINTYFDSNNTYAIFLITLLFKSMLVELKPRK